MKTLWCEGTMQSLSDVCV